MRMIDADVPNKALRKMATETRNVERAMSYLAAILTLEDTPTVDAVPVVRCKDCDNRECEGREGFIVCGIDGTSHPKDWFCADGEKEKRR